MPRKHIPLTTQRMRAYSRMKFKTFTAELTSEQATAALNLSPKEFKAAHGYEKYELTSYLDAAYALYETLGLMPTVEEILATGYRHGLLAVPDEQWLNKRVLKIHTSQAFKTAAFYRGIRDPDMGLDERQSALLAHLTDHSLTSTLAAKLKKLGIEHWEYQAWLKYPPFRDRLRELSKRSLDEAGSVIDTQLASGAAAGRLDFIKYYDQRTGRYDPYSVNTARFDAEAVIRSVLEILMRNIQDPELLRKIGGEISLVAGAAGLDPSSNQNDPAPVAALPKAPPSLFGRGS